LGADFGRLALKILGGPQSRFPHPVSSGALGVDPMLGGKPLQSFDFFQRVFGHQCHLPNGTASFGFVLQQTAANIHNSADTLPPGD
jgi:hypothetical protein